MVDELRSWGVGASGQARRVFGPGTLSCHMTCDGDIEELHELARRIGLRREWFQPRSTPHYDLTPARREKALKNGAVFVPARTQALARFEARKKPPT